MSDYASAIPISHSESLHSAKSTACTVCFDSGLACCTHKDTSRQAMPKMPRLPVHIFNRRCVLIEDPGHVVLNDQLLVLVDEFNAGNHDDSELQLLSAMKMQDLLNSRHSIHCATWQHSSTSSASSFCFFEIRTISQVDSGSKACGVRLPVAAHSAPEIHLEAKQATPCSATTRIRKERVHQTPVLRLKNQRLECEQLSQIPSLRKRPCLR